MTDSASNQQKLTKSLDQLVNEERNSRKRRHSSDERENHHGRKNRRDQSPSGDKQDQKRDRARSPQVESPRVNKVFVGNLSYETTWHRLKDVMRKVGDVQRADIAEDSRGHSRGYGIVEFRAASDARRAIKELHNTQLDGRTIFVREDEDPTNQRGPPRDIQRKPIKRSRSRSNSERKRETQRGVEKRVERDNSGSRESTGARDEDRVKRRDSNSDKGSGKQIYIGNIPYSVTRSQLKDAFKEFGNIVHLDVPIDDRGKSRGYGIVHFENKQSALEAIRQMDRASFNDRVVTVRLDEKA